MLLSNKNITPYLITIFQTIFFAWEWLFLIFFTYSVADYPSAGLLSGFAFLSNSVIRSLFAKKIARAVEFFDEIFRIKLSIILRSIFLCLLCMLPYLSEHPFYILGWLLCVNLILVFDTYCSFHLRFYFASNNHISFVRYSTIGNLGQRGGVVLTSIIALSLSKNNWNVFAEICSVCGIAGVIASFFSLKYLKSNHLVNSNIIKNENRHTKINKIVMLFGFILFLMNLFFGSGALLLTRATLKYHLFLLDSINLVTIFYAGFLLINVMGFLLDKVIQKTSKFKYLAISYFATGITVIFLYPFRESSILCFVFTMIWGMLYGWSSLIFYAYISKLIQGRNQASLFSNIDSASRTGFILSQIMTGILLDLFLDPLKLIQQYGIAFLMIFTILVPFLKKQREILYDFTTG